MCVCVRVCVCVSVCECVCVCVCVCVYVCACSVYVDLPPPFRLDLQENARCLGGRCYCRLGFVAVNGACVADPCAGVQCVENAVCNSTHGLCQCVPPHVPYGPEVRGGVRMCVCECRPI